MNKQRWVLGIEYNGSPFHGWQAQISRDKDKRYLRELPTVQDTLEKAFSKIAGTSITLICAGRTDTGVHATRQVAHFDTTVDRPTSAWVRGVNTLLPRSCAVCWADRVSNNFHANYSAIGRQYRYILLNRSQRPGLLAGRVGWFHRALDVAVMKQSASYLLGTHDFSAFRGAGCQARTSIRTMTKASLYLKGEYLIFDFAANAFLQYMIRNLVGALVYIGKGKAPPHAMADWLAQGKRNLAPATFMPDGLYLTGIDYPKDCGLFKPTYSNTFEGN